MSRPRIATPRFAARRCGKESLRAGDAVLAASEQRPPAQAGQRRAVAAAG